MASSRLHSIVQCGSRSASALPPSAVAAAICGGSSGAPAASGHHFKDLRPLRSVSKLLNSAFKPTNRNYSTSATDDLHIVKSIYPMVPFDSGNYVRYLLKDSHKWEDRVAVECVLTNKCVTYGTLKDHIARWGGYLRSQGLGQGDVIAIISPNILDYSAVALGAISIGCIVTVINPTYTPDEIADQLFDSGSKMTVVFGPLEPIVRASFNICKRDLPMVAIGVPSSTGLPLVSDILADASIPFADAIDINGRETMALMYSSGTTGKPKGVMISHDMCSANIAMISHPTYLAPCLIDPEEAQQCFMLLLPMFHVSGLFGIHSMGIFKGVKLISYPKFEPATFLPVIEKHKVTVLHLVPALINFLSSVPDATVTKAFEHAQSLVCGSAPLSVTALGILQQKTGRDIPFQQAYGMTETLFSTFDPFNDTKLGYCGKVLPGVQAKVIDVSDGSKTLPANVNGEICVKTESVMNGYLNSPEVTAETIDEEGWLHTGDIGYYDEQEYFAIVDRTKDLIKVKGLQVSPSELEDVLMKVPGVQEACVVGVEHDQMGEAPRAYIVAKGGDLKTATVTDFMSTKLAPHKHLAGGIVFVDSLPRNATGKVLRKALQARAREEN